MFHPFVLVFPNNSFRFCQLSLWGAKVKPSSKETSCKFILNDLTSALLGTTTNLTSSVGETLGGTLGGLGNVLGGGKDQKRRPSVGTPSGSPNKQSSGLLGLF